MKSTKELSVKIPFADLISFKKNSAFIKSFGVIPIYDYVLFDSGMMVKSNQREFVIQKAPFMGTFLVEERVLSRFLDYAMPTDITFTLTDKKISISDGVQKVTSQTEDHINFKIPDLSDGKKTALIAGEVEAISHAAKYTKDDENSHITPYVFIGKKAVAASDAMIVFYSEFDVELPEIILPRLNAEKVGTLTNPEYTSTERYNIFESKGVIYGFIKHEVTFQEMSYFFKREKRDSFIVNRKDFLSFNEACVSLSPTGDAYPTFTIENNRLLLAMKEPLYELDYEKKISCDGKMDGKFGYIASHMIKLLKTAPDEDLTFTQSEKVYYITGESGFKSLIVEIYYL